MKNGIFVEKLSNVARFLEGVRTVNARGAREANWLLIEGEPGYGKTNTLSWYSERTTNHKSALIRCKSSYTVHWLYKDIADVLGVESKARSCEDLYSVVLPELMIRANQDNMILIVDEIDHAAKKPDVLEALRDLTDVAECPLIAGGMLGVQPLFRRYKQISSRLADVVTFKPSTVEDVRAVCDALASVRIADDLATEVQKRTGGRLREVKTAIGRIEAYFKRSHEHSKDAVTLDDWRGTKKNLLPNLTALASQGVSNG